MNFFRVIPLFAVMSFPALAAAQTYPEKPIRLILSVPAGATPDVTARLVTPGLSRLLGQQLVVDNRPGAGGMIGAEIASKAPHDGYTLFISSSAAEFAAFVRKDTEKYAKIVKIAGARVD
jgi:tripartite-type tricarboxylate transporter receptor subunit TctC